MRRLASHRVALPVVALLTTLYFLLPDPDVSRPAVYLTMAYGAAAVVVVGIRLWRPERTAFWWLLAGGLFMLASGDVARHVYEWTGRDVSLPSVADAFYLGEYAALIAGFLLLARGLSGGRGWLDATLLDAAVVAVAGGFLLWIVIIEPQVDDQAAGLLERCVSISYPMLDAVLLAVLVRVLMATGKVRAALVFAAVGIGFLLAADGVYGVTTLDGAYVPGGWNDAGWLVGYGLLGTAALHPSMRLVPGRRLREELVFARRRIVLLTAAALVPPLALLAQSLTHHGIDVVSIAVAGTAIPLLALGRLGLLFRDHRRSLAALVREKALSDGLIASSVDGIVVVDRDLRLTIWNPALEALTGFRREQVIGLQASELFPETEESGELDCVRRALAGETVRAFELRHARADGTDITVDVVYAPLTGATGEIDGAMMTVTDVSERVRLEEQLRQAQKMEAVGRLAGGVAHDFNNILTAISGYAEFALASLDDAHPASVDLLEIERAAERAARLTSQLLAFSRRQMLQPKLLDVAKVLHGVEEMLRRLIGEDVELVCAPADDLSAVRADPGQLEQVVLNLAVNARDAMPRGGRLTLAAANEDLPAAPGSVRSGPHVLLTVSDTGEGMDAETLQHVFEPFFTTKEQGKGTGLGLATVYGIVEQSGGWVDVESEPGRGTRFRIYLPCVDGARVAETSDAEALASGGSETVLVVEDEPMVRSLARRTLADRGYRVLEAEDGESALRLSRRHAGPIHLLLSDVVMPGMSGAELVERFARLRPEAAPLFMSGYTDEALGHHGVLDDDVAFVAKPFTPDTLAARVRAALDTHQSTADEAPAAAAA